MKFRLMRIGQSCKIGQGIVPDQPSGSSRNFRGEIPIRSVNAPEKLDSDRYPTSYAMVLMGMVVVLSRYLARSMRNRTMY